VPLPGATPVPGRLAVKLRRKGAVLLDVWRGGVPDQVASDPEMQTGPRLYEQCDYQLHCIAKSGYRVAVHHNDPLVTKGLEYVDGDRIVTGIVNFASQIGRSAFTVSVDGLPELDFETEVFPTKLDYATDYEQILAEVQAILTGLAVEYLRATFQMGRETTIPQPTHLEWLVLLKQVATELERGLSYVERNPVRGLVREPVSVRADRIRRVDSSVRSQIRKRSGSGNLMQAEAGLPIRHYLDERRGRPTLDTPEHRWLARQLDRILQRLGRLRDDESRNDLRREPNERRLAIRRELDALEMRISRLAATEPMKAGEGDPPPGFASMQLLGAPGYREAYRACLILGLGLRIEGNAMRVSVKNLDVLYEYWCYLALLRIVSEETGESIPVKDLFAVSRQGLHVLLNKGKQTTAVFKAQSGRKIKVTYNPRFQDPSVLIPQMPDFVISVEDKFWPAQHLLADAKYRLENTPEYVDRYRAPGPPEDALNAMHRYRDAITEEVRIHGVAKPQRSVIQAAALFPYREPAIGSFHGSRLWDALQKIGVGAIPLLPNDDTYLREWVRSAFQRGGWALAERAVEHRSVERIREWQIAASEPVLVGVLRHAAQQMQWICETGTYYKPLSQQQDLQFAAKILAIYSPSGGTGSGSVTHWAPIIELRIAERSAIRTPWATGQAGNERQIVYKLGGVQELKPAIRNPSGQRLGSHRWTSHLALRRASTLEELLLETEREWRLYEDMKAIGVRFRLRARPPKDIDPDKPRGRVWFDLDDGRSVRFAGSSGFLVRAHGVEDRFHARSEDLIEDLLCRT
jgi:uncharacterized protein